VGVPLIKYLKKTKGKIEQAEVLLSIHCYLANIKLSKSELTVLSYFLVYKIKDSTKDLILKSKILKSFDSLSNTMSKFRSLGLVKKKENREDVLSEDINIDMEDVLGVIIKIENT
jgi:hypothetical protein